MGFQLRLDCFELGLEPRSAGKNLPRVRLAVQPPLAAGGPLEVLDGIGHIDLLARNARFFQHLIEQAAGRTDERLSRAVFDVAGLLAHHHQPGMCRTSAEDGLRRIRKERAALAVAGRFPQRAQVMLLRQEGGGGRPNFGHGGRMRTHAQVGSSAPTTRTAQRAIRGNASRMPRLPPARRRFVPRQRPLALQLNLEIAQT
jgi:hypothetical protein